MKRWFIIIAILIAAIILGLFVYPAVGEKVGFDLSAKPFIFGLDIRGGTHLVYEADVSDIPDQEQEQAMEGLRDVIERRVNLFGVSEPLVAVNKVGDNWRLIVELAGITDVNQAIETIGQTPFLEFREVVEAPPAEATVNEDGEVVVEADPEQQISFKPTPLTGRFLSKAVLGFAPQTNGPIIQLEFNEEGAQLFAELTRENIGKPLAIFLDGVLLSAPVVQQEITGGQAQITGNFGIAEARELVRNLNAGALPVPIDLVTQQTIGATLGEASLYKSLLAGIVGFAAVALFMILVYRLAGIVSVLNLTIYVIIVLAIFKLIPVTLTLAGIVGFILSIGMAVDANILVFERMKEELRAGRSFGAALEEGFDRAWTAIRDAYTSTFLTAAVLYWFGSSLVRGFAVTLILGLLVSLLTSLVITKLFIRALADTKLASIKMLWRQ